MCGVTRLDKIRNEHIKESLGVTNISEKMKRNRSNNLDMLKEEIIDTVKKLSEISVEENQRRTEEVGN